MTHPGARAALLLLLALAIRVAASRLLALELALGLGAHSGLLALPVALGLLAERRADRVRRNARRVADRRAAHSLALQHQKMDESAIVNATRVARFVYLGAALILAHLLGAANRALGLLAVHSALGAGGLRKTFEQTRAR